VSFSIDHVQLNMFDTTVKTSMVRVTRRANKRAGRVARLQPSLPIRDRRYMPVVGVPKTRDECRDGLRPCPYVRCRWSLFREDAEHRAGRPGIGNVPRDARGLTLRMHGNAGSERAGTTLRPAWLELERRCKAMLVFDEEGRFVEFDFTTGFNRPDWGSWDAMVIHPGEPVEILSDEYGELLAKASMRDGQLVMDRQIPFGVAATVVIERVRGVPSCALDLIERHGKMSNEQVGDAIGRHRTLVAREVKRAGKKLKGMGVDLRDLLGESI